MINAYGMNPAGLWGSNPTRYYQFLTLLDDQPNAAIPLETCDTPSKCNLNGVWTIYNKNGFANDKPKLGMWLQLAKIGR